MLLCLSVVLSSLPCLSQHLLGVIVYIHVMTSAVATINLHVSETPLLHIFFLVDS